MAGVVGGTDGAVLWQVVSTSGASAPFDLISLGTLFASSIVTGVGAAGTLSVFLDVSDASGNWQQQIALTPQTAVGVQSAAFPVSAAVQSTLIGRGRLRWTSTGTFSVALAAVGK